MAELVGGAFLSSFLNVLFDRMATSEFLCLFKTRKMDMKLLQKLQIWLNTINGVLDDAESKQIANPAVKKWLDELRDAAFEADDILDLIAYEAATTAKDEADLTTGKQIQDLFSFRNPFKKASQEDHSEEASSLRDFPQRMKQNVERLQLLVQQIDPIGLRQGAGKEAPIERGTSSVVDESIIFGRDADREAILKLLQEDDAEFNSIGVIPIVGMGGIGKTTLAQLIYNDDRVAKLFACRVWVCVSDIYDEVRIKRQILAGVDSSSAATNGSFLQQIDVDLQQTDVELQQSLKDKKFLLVLDDLWNYAYGHWDKLLTPLKSGARGSKILITTRNQKIASNMGTIGSPHDLRELDDDICWQIFEKHVFKGGKGDERLESIGRKIASKCRGLPLAAKMLGGLLRGNQDEAEWEKILGSKTWQQFDDDKVLPALRLSYQHLPSHLKQCFAYCAIFPKDYEIGKEQLIRMWMAEGFLVSPKTERTEKWGEKCFQELISRSFFQEHNNKFGAGSHFLMHHLINDLAQLVSGEFSMRMEGEDSFDFNSKNRYFSFSFFDDGILKMIDNIRRAKFLRTFCCLSVRGNTSYSLRGIACQEAVDKLVSSLRCLRVLSFPDFFEMTELPDSIEHLKHLRYLNLTVARLERLPETVCALYNLQTLILSYCFELVELPEKMRELINLHCLDIRGAIKLQKMPPEMGKLKHLVILTDFILGKQSGSDLNELGKLQHLQGELSVSNLQNVVNIPNDVLKNKKELEALKLEWSGGSGSSAHDLSVLKQLQPHTSIKKVSIVGYGGTKLADWVGFSSYTNLVSLRIDGCENCFSLPQLGSLSYLKYLSISNCGAMTEVKMAKRFESLETLEIEHMEEWEDWRFCEENDFENCGSLAKLEKLTIKNCPKLKTILTSGPTHMVFCSLHYLFVEKCPNFKIFQLVAISNFKQLAMKTKHPGFKKIKTKRPSGFSKPLVRLEELPSAMYSLHVEEQRIERIEEMGVALNALEEVKIKENELCECIPLEVFPALKSLYVKKCCNLKSLSASGEPHLTFLAHLKIYWCESLICFPKGGISAPNMRHLELVGCYNLKSLPEGMNALLPSLECLKIAFCWKVESFPEGGLPANLQSLEISYCSDKLIDGCWQVGLQTLDALSSLILIGYGGDKLNCFPFPPALTTLKMQLFENLKFMNCKDLQRLTHLSILCCPNLESFLQEGLPSSTSVVKTESVAETQSFQRGGLLPNLQSLEIWRCDELIGRRLQWGLQRFNALSHLTFSSYEKDDLSSFPEDYLLLPSTLISLEICDFAELEEINYKGLQHLTSLSKLEIHGCEKLRCLPEGLPSSLSVLQIFDCDLLKRRCEREKGQDWLKISHISNIEIC